MEVLTHARQIRYASARGDAGIDQQRGGPDCPGAQHDFLSGANDATADLDPDGPSVLDDHASHGLPRQDLRALLAGQAAEELPARRAAKTAPLVDLAACHPRLVATVRIRVELVAGVHRRLNERVVDLVVMAAPRDGDGAGSAAIVIGSVDPGLQRLEVGEHVAVGPPGRAGFGPTVVVGSAPSRVDHRIDGSTAPDDSPAGEGTRLPVLARFGCGGVLPIGCRVEGDDSQWQGHVGASIGATRFHQDHTRSGRSQPSRDDRTGGACPNYDVIGNLRVLHAEILWYQTTLIPSWERTYRRA